MSATTLRRPAGPPPRTPLHLVAPAPEPEPCAIPWCVKHEDFGNLCTGTQATIGDHAVSLIRDGDAPNTTLLVSLFRETSIIMTPAEALAFADEMVRFSRLLTERAQAALADPAVAA